jgi:hypothetical protein
VARADGRESRGRVRERGFEPEVTEALPDGPSDRSVLSQGQAPQHLVDGGGTIHRRAEVVIVPVEPSPGEVHVDVETERRRVGPDGLVVGATWHDPEPTTQVGHRAHLRVGDGGPDLLLAVAVWGHPALALRPRMRAAVTLS